MRRGGAAAAASALVLVAAVAGAAEPTLPKGGLFKSLTAPGVVLGAPVALSADRLEYDEDTGILVAEGNVEGAFGNRSIRADRVRYDSRKGEAEFSGRVHYTEQGDEFSFDRIVIDIDRQTGVLYNGTIRLSAHDYQIASEQFEKTGEATFAVRNGSLTTCPCDPVCDWKFNVGRSRVALDGYAVGRNITFRIRDIPVFWLPWGAFPVKLSRQTGFLLPSLSASTIKGTSVTLPFFWAISRWNDATITVETMSKRGIRPEAEFRYALNPVSDGAIRYTEYRDKVLRETRFRAYGENVFSHADRWTLNARWDIPSDDAYYRDLVDDDILRTGRHVPSRAFAAFQGSDTVQSLGVDWVEDLQGTPDDNTVQRLPEYTATLLPLTLRRTGLDLSGEFAGTRFERRAAPPEWRGRVSAEVSRPLALYRSVVLTPYAGVHALRDSLHAAEGAEGASGRAVSDAGAVVQAEWTRAFARPGGKRLVHALSPAAGFRWVSEADQADIPLTDFWARVAPQQEFTLSLSQRLVRLEEGKGPAEVAFLEVAWAYDLAAHERPESPYVDPLSPYFRTLRDQIDLAAGRPEGGGDKASDIYARFLTRPAAEWGIAGEALFDVGDGRATSAAVGAEWKREREKKGERGQGSEKGRETRVLLEYRISRGLAEDLRGLVDFRPIRFLGFRASGTYSLQQGELDQGSAGVTLYPRSECWSVGFSVERKTNPDDTSIRLSFGLKGIGDYGK